MDVAIDIPVVNLVDRALPNYAVPCKNHFVLNVDKTTYRI